MSNETVPWGIIVYRTFLLLTVLTGVISIVLVIVRRFLGYDSWVATIGYAFLSCAVIGVSGVEAWIQLGLDRTETLTAIQIGFGFLAVPGCSFVSYEFRDWLSEKASPRVDRDPP